MGRTGLAGILIALIVLLYGIQTYMLQSNKTKSKETFADASGSSVDGSGNDLNFPDLFAKFLNKLFENVKFTPTNELDEKSLSITTPELETIGTNLDNKISPMISQGIDALRAASAAQDSVEFTPLM